MELYILDLLAGQYRGSIFKIPMLTQWMVVVTGPQMIEDVRRASDDQLSSKDALAEVICHPYCHACNLSLILCHKTLHFDILLGREVFDDGFHVDVIRSQLTRNIAARFSDIQDEITAGFADYVPTKGNGKHQQVLRKTKS